MGFSPFELLCRRTVRGPLGILREVWDREQIGDVRTTFQYVFELREKLEETYPVATMDVIAATAMIEETEEVEENPMTLPSMKQKETWRQVNINEKLTAEQAHELKCIGLLYHYEKRLLDAGMTARPTKCYLAMQTLQYLGHMFDIKGLSPLKKKVEQILNAPQPKTKELRSFLVLSGFYRKYIPNYATIAAPLTDMVRKNQPNQLKWEDQHSRSFQ
ncbi:hypothetical protein Pcinc_000491 [Petrolisthes cinctipes]|uniref:Reverse transcriptase n=1 Tax=Petrolisthes cinctipes TaxID=88211 RepID=A0AAE1L5D0_PETCI|nr:hypothetical protein Pcinc_000491 [Petrolisthes cinctipes]